MQLILESHNAWNEDHLKIGAHDMILSVEDNVNAYIDEPELITQLLKQRKEQSD